MSTEGKHIFVFFLAICKYSGNISFYVFYYPIGLFVFIIKLLEFFIYARYVAGKYFLPVYKLSFHPPESSADQ